MDTDFLFKQETHTILGCAMEVFNGVGSGLKEKIYENGLIVEFKLRKIPCQQQRHFDVYYKEVKIGEYVPDLIVFDKIIVDTKTIDEITRIEMGQMLNYLKITNRRVGLIINFKNAKLEWKRVAR
jgi:GxxExxY protein